MGFLGEIERRKQQGIQEELARKAEAEKQIKLAARQATDELARKQHEHEVNAGGFISDCQTLIPILEQFDRFEYKDYLKGVSEVTGFYPSWAIYMNHTRRDFGLDSNIPLNEIRNKGSESTKKQLQLQEKVDQLCNRLFPYTGMGSSIFGSAHIKSTNSEFFEDSEKFIDKNYKKRNSWNKRWGNVEASTKSITLPFDEPKEIALGIRFTKDIDWTGWDTIRSGREQLTFGSGHPVYYRSWWDVLHQTWSRAVYVRITNDNSATITCGSLQLRTDLSNIRMFDDALAKVMNDPVLLYEKKVSRSVEKSPRSYSER